MRLDLAFCVELNRVVDIQEACQEFSAQDIFLEFHFLCSDPICRANKKGGVRVTGVNHYRLPEEQVVHNSPHYRKLDDHIPSCDWMELEEARREEELAGDLSRDATAERNHKLQRKLTRLITRFIVPEDSGGEGTSSEVVNQLDKIRTISDRATRRKELLDYARGVGATATSLEALVSCYEELKDEDALDEEFTVKGYGSISFRNAFRQVSLGSKEGFVVYYGGTRLFKRYGAGFALSFMDKLQENRNDKTFGISISLYVSPDNLKKYRPGAKFRRMVDEVEINAQRRPYLKVYWIGNLEKKEQNYGAVFSTLAHVVMRLVYPAEKPIETEPALTGLE